MMIPYDFSEEETYKRMQKTAIKVWNIKESEINSIDPLVQLLMRGMAKEMEKVGHELQNSETRILKRIARQLMPDQLQTATPAHSIMYIQPSEKTELSRYDHFSIEKRWQNKVSFNRIETRTLNFTPAGSFPVNPGNMRYRIEHDKSFHIKGIQKLPLPDIDIGLSPNEIVLGLENLIPGEFYLYFDWPVEQRNNMRYNSLSKSRISFLNGNSIETKWGLKSKENSGLFFEEKFDSLLKVEQTVVAFYKKRFIKVSLTAEELKKGHLSENEMQNLKDQLVFENEEDIHWIKISFPQEIEPKHIEELFVQINCLPVINRKMSRQVFRLQPELNIRKFEFEGHFLGVERVETSRGEIYKEQDSIRLDESLKGTYTVRTGNVGRIDQRDGHSYLKYLLDLLREEKQAFSSANVSSTLEDLNTIEQTVEKIEKRINFTGASGVEPYIIVTSAKNFENIYVHFWSTDGNFANGLNAHSKLVCETPGLSSTGEAILLKNTLGGTDGLMDAELIRNYKNAVLTKESIVTVADIKSLARAIGGNAISTVEVKKEIGESNLPKVGLIQQLNIYLKFKRTIDNDILKNYIVQNLEAELEAKSNFSIPVQIFVLDE